MAPLPRTYRILRAIVRGALRLFFREIDVEGREHLPGDRGGLLVAWHPNGIIDAGIMLAAFPGHVVFGARDGLLRWPLIGWVMRRMGTVPIYRAKDHIGEGEAARREANARSLDALAAAIASGSFSALFPEGQSHDAPHVTALKSGAARLFLRAREMAEGDGASGQWPVADGTRPEETAEPSATASSSLATGPPEASGGSPVIVPVGLHYDAKAVFRSDVLVVFHPPLAVAPEADARELTGAMEVALDQAVSSTDDWDLHHTMMRAASLVRAEAAAREGRRAEPAPLAERRLDFEQMWTGYHARRETHPDEIEALRREVAAYRRKLGLLGMDDADLDRPVRSAPTQFVRTALQGVLAYVVLRPLLVIGMIVNAPPYWALKPLAKRVATAEKDTATVKLLGGMVLFPLAWIAAALFAVAGLAPLRTVAPWVPDAPLAIGLGAFVLSIVGAVVALRGSELTVETWRALRARWTRRRHAGHVERLRATRGDLFDRLVAMAQAPEAVPPGASGV
ncbi:MAG: 1-acyl-sn-glycerol-3-phosphate acyltransferase [Bacteroidota bacterium]